jgi:hypothetical protein
VSAELSTLQTRAVTLLDAATYFSELAVVEFTDGTMASRIQQLLLAKGLATADGNKTVKRGIACIVGITQAAVTHDRRLVLAPLLRIAVLENPLVNTATGGANKNILDVVVEIFRALSGQPLLAGVRRADAVDKFVGTGLELIPNDVRRVLYGVEGGNAFHCNFSVGQVALEQTQTQ